MWVPNVLVVVERLVHVAAKDVLGVIVHTPLMLCSGCIHAAVARATAAPPGLAALVPGQVFHYQNGGVERDRAIIDAYIDDD